MEQACLIVARAHCKGNHQARAWNLPGVVTGPATADLPSTTKPTIVQFSLYSHQACTKILVQWFSLHNIIYAKRFHPIKDLLHRSNYSHNKTYPLQPIPLCDNKVRLPANPILQQHFTPRRWKTHHRFTVDLRNLLPYIEYWSFVFSHVNTLPLPLKKHGDSPSVPVSRYVLGKFTSRIIPFSACIVPLAHIDNRSAVKLGQLKFTLKCCTQCSTRHFRERITGLPDLLVTSLTPSLRSPALLISQ